MRAHTPFRLLFAGFFLAIALHALPSRAQDVHVRVSWSPQLTLAEAEQFKPKIFLAGTDHWDPEAEAAKPP